MSLPRVGTPKNTIDYFNGSINTTQAHQWLYRVHNDSLRLNNHSSVSESADSNDTVTSLYGHTEGAVGVLLCCRCGAWECWSGTGIYQSATITIGYHFVYPTRLFTVNQGIPKLLLQLESRS